MPKPLADIPDLQRPEQLDATVTIRISTSDRERLAQTAADLGVRPGPLLRAVLRHALDQAGSPTN